jgi:hypothetical protein
MIVTSFAWALSALYPSAYIHAYQIKKLGSGDSIVVIYYLSFFWHNKWLTSFFFDNTTNG